MGGCAAARGAPDQATARREELLTAKLIDVIKEQATVEWPAFFLCALRRLISERLAGIIPAVCFLDIAPADAGDLWRLLQHGV